MIKENLSEVTISQLETLTGKHFRTIRNRIGNLKPLRTEGSSIFFDPKDALPLIFAPDFESSDTSENTSKLSKQLEKEKVRNERAKADKMELTVERLRGNLIPADMVERVWSNMTASFRAKILALPTKVALSIVGLKSPAEGEAILRDKVEEALSELAEYRPEQYDIEDRNEGAEAGGTSAEADGESVGGSGAAAQ